MTTVRALVDIPSRRGTIKAGTVFTVQPETLPKLTGKVEPVPLTHDQAASRIGAVAEELNQAGNWLDNVFTLISPEARDRIQRANAAVDHAADVLRDAYSLDLALGKYQEAWSAALKSITGDSSITQRR